MQMPRLAVLNCMAPFDAAIHDAWGAALAAPLYAAYTAEYLNEDLSAGPWRRLRRPLSGGTTWARDGARSPCSMSSASNDALIPTNGERAERSEEIVKCATASLNERGREPLCASRRPDDLDRGAGPTCAISSSSCAASRRPRTAARLIGSAHRRLPSDGSRRYGWADRACRWTPMRPTQQAAMMLEVLDRVAVEKPQALAALDYIEQPTPRDLGAYTDTLHDVAARVPVVVDESLDDLGQSRLDPPPGMVRAGGEDLQGPYAFAAGLLLGPPARSLSHPARPHQPRPGARSQRQLLRPPAASTSTASRATTASSCLCRGPHEQGRPPRLLPGLRRPTAPAARHGAGPLLGIGK